MGLTFLISGAPSSTAAAAPALALRLVLAARRLLLSRRPAAGIHQRIAAHESAQDALADTAIRDPQPGGVELLQDGFQNGATGNHQVGALRANGRTFGTGILRHISERLG